MDTVNRLARLLPPNAAGMLLERRDSVTEARLRANRQAQIVWQGGEALAGEPLPPEKLKQVVAALMDYSFYARESELAKGFFTMNDGSRVGVCGRFAGAGDSIRLTDIGSVCVRIARQLPGCADELMGMVAPDGAPHSMLLLSPPGLGKTTLLRDIARQLSEAGYRVGVADERHELAACHMGAPTLDVGPRTDVADGCPRPMAIRQLLRTMAPDVIVADEIGGPGDAEALADAARCGVAVVCSAHAGAFRAALARPWLKDVLECGAIECAALLGEKPGHIREIRSLRGGGAEWRRA